MLVTGLIFLVIVTLLALALFRSSGLMERISANSRDKQRSFEAAQAALQYGEWWLGNSTTQARSPCFTTSAAGNATGKTTASPGLFICSENLAAGRDIAADLTSTSSWQTHAFAYTPGNLTTGAGGGLITGGTDIKYTALPGVYVEDLGPMSTDPQSELYQVTAYGYGGNADTATVVRSTYKVTTTTTVLSGL